MVKFRNMNNDRDENGNLLPAAQRVTKFGHFMRKYSLDELLNFWSAVKWYDADASSELQA